MLAKLGLVSAALWCQEVKAALTNSTWLRLRAELTHPGELQWEGCAELSCVMGLAAWAAIFTEAVLDKLHFCSQSAALDKCSGAE